MNISYMIQGHEGRGIVPPWKYIVNEALADDDLKRIKKSLERNWLIKHVSASSNGETSTFLIVMRFTSLRRLTVKAGAKKIASRLYEGSFWLKIHDHRLGKTEWMQFVKSSFGRYSRVKENRRAMAA